MAEYKLDGTREKVAFLMDNIPHSRDNYLHLLLTYWQVFDGIQIPQEVVHQIIEKGTSPETITRSKRSAKQLAHYKEILEL